MPVGLRQRRIDFWVATLFFVLPSILAQQNSSCLQQDVLMYPGTQYNLTVPSPQCFNAEIQDARGNHQNVAIPPSSCANTNDSYLTVEFADDTPAGPLNLTFSCLLIAPSCRSFTIGNASESTSGQSSTNNVHHYCVHQPILPPVCRDHSPGSRSHRPVLAGSHIRRQPVTVFNHHQIRSLLLHNLPARKLHQQRMLLLDP